MKNTLLSHLPEDEMILNEHTEHVLNVGEIIEEGTEDLRKDGWYVANKETWKPSAQQMLEQYLDNESDDMYEDFSENVYHSLKDVLPKIQDILNQTLENDSVCDVYRCDYTRPVEIDM